MSNVDRLISEPLDERCEITLDSPNQELHEWMSKRMVLRWTTRHKVKHWEKVSGEWEDGHHPDGQNCYLTDDRRSTARVYAAYIDDRVKGKFRTLEMRSNHEFLEDHRIRTIEDFIIRSPDQFISYIQVLEVDVVEILRWQVKYKKQGRFSEFYRSSKREWERLARECPSLEIINRLAELLPGMKRNQLTNKFFRHVKLPPVAAPFIRDKEAYKNYDLTDHFSKRNCYETNKDPVCIMRDNQSEKLNHTLSDACKETCDRAEIGQDPGFDKEWHHTVVAAMTNLPDKFFNIHTRSENS